MAFRKWLIYKMRNDLYPILRTKLGIKSLTATKNKYSRKLMRKIYNRKFSIHELEQKLINLGIKKGDTICIHSSWDEFYNFNGSPEDFIDLVLRIIGEEGTLMMPSYPFLRKPDSIFNLKSTPTKAGLIPEVFRTYCAVERSIDIHSVAAFGKHAKFLTETHINSETSWDENSPYYKLGIIKGKVLNFGLGKHHVGTVMHCADSILRKEFEYFDLFFKKQTEVKIKKLDGEIITKKYFTSEDDFSYIFTEKSHWNLIKSNFDSSKYKIDRISNLHITLFDADYTINKAIELGRKGKVVYLYPDPKNYNF